MFKWLERRTEPFQLLWRSCEARAGLLMCEEGARKPFQPLWRSCEARASLFKMPGEMRKAYFLYCGGPVKLVQAC